jgi:hypothetical protein
MNLINRYVSEVGKHLPLLTGREDIEKELRSTLEDMLEERAEKAGRAADEAMEIELLKEYGSPEKVAATYNSHPYLIGPQMFPFFIRIFKIVVFGIVIGLSVVTIIEILTQMPMAGNDLVQMIIKGIGNIIYTTIVAFGNVVLAFAILERVDPNFQSKLPDLERQLPDLNLSNLDLNLDSKKEWDPTSLLKGPEPDSVNRGELIAEVVFTFIGLMIINGIFNFPIFSEEFLKFVPWINLVSLAGIVLNIYLLRAGSWSPSTRISSILIDLAGIAITVGLLRTPNVFSFATVFIQNVPETSSVDLIFLKRIVDISITGSLIVAIIIQGVEIAKSIFGLLKINYKTK